MPTLAGELTGGSPLTAPPAMPTMAVGAGSFALAHLAQPPAMPPARYQLGAEIARGGMGRVVDATDSVLGRVVAFKEALTTDVDTLRRFERETRITARLEHPSIVPVHDAGASSNGSPFYVMRKVSGRPLERLVAAAETLGQRLALIPHLLNTSQAIAHAHARGIVHRDIKPSNILVGELGETVVIDWGLAKVIGEPDDDLTAKPLVDLSDSLKTRAGIVYGTPGFMAPEQLRGVPVTPGFDVYALGATLYHLLSRKPPHYAQTADEMMKAAVAAAPTPIHELVDGVPPDLSDIVDKALAHDPAVRYQNARELAEDLQRFLTGQLVAAHHYSPREKLVRLIRKNRGVSAAIAAIILVGTISVVRVVRERDRADAEARRARAAELDATRKGEEKQRETEQLILNQARFDVELNPTMAVALIKPLAARYGRETRAIAAAARAAGVAWGIPVSKQTWSLELSPDGLRALSAGDDGVVRLHDLVKHTTRTIIDLHESVEARFADDGRQIVIWHANRLVVLDAAGKRRDLTTPELIDQLRVVGMTAYWVDAKRDVWQLDLAGAAPTPLGFPEPIHEISPSPDGRWIALSGEEHLLLYDRTQPTAPLRQVTQAQATNVAWSATGDDFAALVIDFSGQSVLGVTMAPEPHLIHRQTTINRNFVMPSGGVIYVVGPAGIAISSREDRPRDPTPTPLAGVPRGLVASRAGTVVAGATLGLTVISPVGVRVLPLQGLRVERVAASPRSPYLIAALDGHLLVWNLDDVQPRVLADNVAGRVGFATADHVIIGGSEDEPAQWIDVASGKPRELAAWPGLDTVAAVASATRGQPPTVAVLDRGHHVHLLVPGRPAEDLPGDIDLVGFATPDQLVLASRAGAIFVHDLERHQRTQLAAPGSPLIGLAWGRGHHPWIAGAFADGSLWRKNLATGAEATVARAPKFDPAKPLPRDGRLLVAADGTVVFLHDTEVHAWRPAGSVERVARLAKPLEDFGELEGSRIAVLATDRTVYVVDRGAHDAAGPIPEAIPSSDATKLAMSPDTGLLALLDQGELRVADPLARQRWTLAPAIGVTFEAPHISADGRRVLAFTKPSPLHNTRSLLVWTLDLPTTTGDTERWLDAMTNATTDVVHAPGVLTWR
jgi:hypothetical protein